MLHQNAPKEQKPNDKGTPKDILLAAAKKGDLNSVKDILALNPKIINEQDKEGHTALIHAAWHNHADIVEYLIFQGARLNLPTFAGLTPVHCAASYGHEKTLRILLEHKADVNYVSRKDKTALSRIVEENVTEMDKRLRYLRCAYKLIEHGANINFQDRSGNSILQNTKDYAIFECLLEYKADVNLANPNNGRTPLLTFSEKPTKPNLLKIKKLVDSGANVNVIDKEGHSALDLLLKSKQNNKDHKEAITYIATLPTFDESLKTEAVKKIINSKSANGISLILELNLPLPKASLNELFFMLYEAKQTPELLKQLDKAAPLHEDKNEDVLDKEGNNLLMRTIKDKVFDIAPKLIPFSKLETRNNDDKSALDLAIDCREIKLVKAILDAGVNPNHVNKKGKSILSQYMLEKEIAILLINSNKMDLSYVDTNDNTYLIKAIKQKYLTIAKTIAEKYPHNINAKNKKGYTALFTAIHEGNKDDSRDYIEIIEVLLKKGADSSIACPDPNVWTGIQMKTAYELGHSNYAFGRLLKSYKPAEAKKAENMPIALSSVSGALYSAKKIKLPEPEPERQLEIPAKRLAPASPH
jgi:ankyrin repeat protein